MNYTDILSKVDHTLLTQTAVWEDVRVICDDAIKYGCASVCISPSFVAKAKSYVGDKMRVCTVIGFPNGYSTTNAKCAEAQFAIDDGADEIDMVINLGYVKACRYDKVLAEIRSVREICICKTLKVIIETCLLTEEEKIQLCEIVSLSGADYIKTSTGFSSGGATREDIALMASNIFGGLKIKAAGGIASLEDARDFVALGAERLGTSRIVKIIKNEDSGGY